MTDIGFDFYNTNILVPLPGLRGEGEDVGARAAQDQGSLRQQVEGQPTKVIQNGAGINKPELPGNSEEKFPLLHVRFSITQHCVCGFFSLFVRQFSLCCPKKERKKIKE